MCGIIGYVGSQDVAPILIDGLKRLEYRGYDSAGIVIIDKEAQLFRAVGKVSNLEKRIGSHPLVGSLGMAHTRWATHGKPSEPNAHPHADCHGRLFIIHNGIIENFQTLKQDLLDEGHTFRSETDSEVIAHLIEKYYDGNLAEAVRRALARVDGTFGLAVIHKDHLDQAIVARRSSPLILGIGDGEHFFASDVAALVKHTKRVVYLDENEMAVLTPHHFTIGSLDKPDLVHSSSRTVHVDWDITAAEKQGYSHFMLKEIFEQPEAVRNAFRGRLLPAKGTAKLGGLDSVIDRLQAAHRIIIISCGTSYHAGLLGRYVLEELTDLSVEVDLASEFRYRKLNFRYGTVVLGISQSGETADTLAAVREAQTRGALALGLVNVVGSSIARETSAGVYNHAGPEISVASTKSFISQVTILTLISLMLGRLQKLSLRDGKAIITALEKLPSQIETILSNADEILRIAKKFADYKNFLYLGRKYSYPVALEGALKLKEISYLHAEGYAAGEMKHGPIALIDRQLPSICIVPRDSSYPKMVSNIQETKARDGRVIAIATQGDDKLRSILRVEDGTDEIFYIPETLEILSPILSVVPLQLLAYYVADLNGCDIDKPRNLAKSVTVE
ncbi:MAG: glutamine--fructose-6-phosphate transaminase (isomerizing) [Acidobacteria bacterium]|nr:glutamine--fructose-6-phosphate transaminase (isomerizing) [Acidobacteriota bacterium]MBI3656385.1 glutamine--fructose-6-phosphate transaminase (isomerizing) [Acidobacteriota bacterium]